MGWNPAKEVKKYYNRVKDAAKGGINNLKKETEHQINRVKWHTGQGIKQVQGEAKNGVSQVKKETDGFVKSAKREIEDESNRAMSGLQGALDQIPDIDDAIQAFLDELAKGFSKQGLKVTRSMVRKAKEELDKIKGDDEIIDDINAFGFDLAIGPVTLGYDHFYTRADNLIAVLDSFANNPPAIRRSQIIPLIDALGPTTVNLGLDIKFAFGASSDALGFGFSIKDIPLRAFTRLGDVLLKELGVPK